MSDRVQIQSKVEPVRSYRSTEFFVYTPAPAIAALSDAATTVQLAVQLQIDSDFELMMITYAADIAGAAQDESSRVIPLVTIQIQQAGSGNDIMPVPVPLSSVAGDGRLPFILPESKIWQANSSMSITLARYAAAGTSYNIRLSFLGRKLFF